MELMLAIRDVEGEPRVRDEELGRFLGMAEPRNIRRTIKAHIEEFQAFGILGVSRPNSGLRGRPTEVYDLNRPQSVLACILGDTPKAKEMRVHVIRSFEAYERGEVSPRFATAVPSPDAALGALAQALAMMAENQRVANERQHEMNKVLRLGSHLA